MNIEPKPKEVDEDAHLVIAMTALVMLVLDRGDNTVTSTKEKILAAVGEYIGVVTFIIPALKDVVGQQSHHVMKGSEARD